MEERKLLSLTPQEIQLIRLIRGMERGEVHIFVKDNTPFRVESIKRNIQLDK